MLMHIWLTTTVQRRFELYECSVVLLLILLIINENMSAVCLTAIVKYVLLCRRSSPLNLHLASSEQWFWSGGRGGVLSGWSTGSGFDLIGPPSLSPPSTSVSSDFMVLCKSYFSLPSSGLGLVGLALDLVDWPTFATNSLSLPLWKTYLNKSVCTMS